MCCVLLLLSGGAPFCAARGELFALGAAVFGSVLGGQVVSVGVVLLLVFMAEQNCVIVNWNVRGLNQSARRQVVRDLVRDTKATIVSLQETKLDHIDRVLVLEILGSAFVDNFVYLPAIGTRGGILLAVHEGHYHLKSSELGVHSVTANIETSSALVDWSITAVYGPQEDNEKIHLLGELRWVKQFVPEKWLLLGDFNMILQATDKSNANLNRRLMGAFRDVVRDLELKELALRGRKFTWSNDRTQTRIDRAFCTTAWDLLLPNVGLQALSSRVSDHCPLLLAGNVTMPTFKGF